MKKPIVYICILLSVLLGTILYFASPAILLGSKVANERISEQESTKATIQNYLNETQPELLKATEFSYDGESSNRYLVATVTDSETSDFHNIYYDLKKDVIVYDDYKMEQLTPSSPLSFDPKFKNMGDEIRFYDNLRYVYEKELKTAQIQQKTDKARRIEEGYESISINLGDLYNKQDAELYQD